MRIRIIMLIVALLTTALSVSPAVAQTDMGAALDYLKTQQNNDAGFGSGFSPDSAIGSTADVVLAIIAAGGDLSAFSKDGKTPIDYLAANAANAPSAGDQAKLVLALVAGHRDPSAFGGVDLLARLEGLARPDGTIGGPGDTFVSHLMAVLALKGAGRSVSPAAIDRIRAAQQENGAWAWDGSNATAPDTNTTAFAVEALIAAGEPADSEAVVKALAYYRSIQNVDGGWPYQNPSEFGTTTDANSTAVTIQALIAAGQDVSGAGWSTASGKTPVTALGALQNASGAFAWKADTPGDNLLATVQALPALAGKALPIRPVGRVGIKPVWLILLCTAAAAAAVLLVLGWRGRRGRAKTRRSAAHGQGGREE